MTAHRYGDFGLEITFDNDEVLVRVRGDIDMLTASTLGAVLAGLADEGHAEIVVDLAGVTFLGAAALAVLGTTSARLGELGVLTIRSAPTLTRRILDITGMTALVRIEASPPAGVRLGAERLAGDRSASVNPRFADLSFDLARIGSVPTSTEVIDEALRLVTELASAAVGGADGVSVSVQRQGRLTTVASSNATVLRMDDHQYDTGEGPCVAAAAEGHWFHVESLAQEDRWPAFIPRAIEEGIASILSTPLLAADRPLGALNIYSSRERAFGPDEQELAAMFGTQASMILASAGADLTDKRTAARIDEALRAREVIAQAQGVLMARQRITADDADATLHRWSRAESVSVLQKAAELVTSTATTVADPEVRP